MIYFILPFLLICCYGVTIRHFQPDYLSIPKTTAIKGIFTVFIFLSHVRGYCGSYLPIDAGIHLLNVLDQMVVVMFFFYSGFGIMKQYEKRGDLYLHSFLKNRVLKLLFHFDVAVFLFIIAQLLLGNKYPLSNYLYSWIGWESIGNSNWFIFDILILYLITYFSLKISVTFSLSKFSSVIFLSAITILLWFFLFHYKQGEAWWYNTIITFPLGAIYALGNFKIDNFRKQKPLPSIGAITVMLILWIVLRFIVGIDPYGLSALLFSLFMVGLTTFISFDNAILRWLGKHCFTIYILQRLPMIILSHFNFGRYYYLFIISSFAMTILLASGFQFITDKMDRRLFA